MIKLHEKRYTQSPVFIVVSWHFLSQERRLRENKAQVLRVKLLTFKDVFIKTRLLYIFQLTMLWRRLSAFLKLCTRWIRLKAVNPLSVTFEKSVKPIMSSILNLNYFKKSKVWHSSMPLLEITKLLRVMFQILDFKWQAFENKHTQKISNQLNPREL